MQRARRVAQARAVGVAQMEYSDNLVQSRINNAQSYNDLLKDVSGITLPPKKEWAKNVYWMYGILVEDNFGISKDSLMTKLKEKGIDTRSFFIPMHEQPIYKKNDEKFPDTQGKYPVSEELYRKGLYLPSSSHLPPTDIKQVVNTIKQIQSEFK